MLRSTRCMLSVVATTTAVLACQVTAASAAKVGVVGPALVYAGVGTEANDLRLARHGTDLVVRDLTATLVPGNGCTGVTAHKATCAAAGVSAFSADLGRGADRAVISNLVRLPQIVVRGGLGNDTLESVVAHVTFFGGPGRDRLIGGAGDDRIYGGRGDDVLRGGPGDDTMADFSGWDHLYGGTGEDYLNTFELVPDGRPGDFLNASKGPDYGCRASPDDILVGCDENAK